MISVKPGSVAWSVLELVVDHPGDLDAESIGQRLWRPKLTSTDNYLRVRRACSSIPEWAQRASTVLGRLQNRGLVERMRPHQLAQDIPGAPATANYHELAAWASDVWADSKERRSDAGVATTAVKLLVRLVQQKPRSLSEWAGLAPTGATARTVHALVESGIVVPPQCRWPTAAGVELVEHARESV